MNLDTTVAVVEEKFKEIGVQVNTILELKSKHDFKLFAGILWKVKRDLWGE